MRLYNTLTKQVEDIVPADKSELKLFVCGPTVYDYSHIGHAKTYTQFDVLVRSLRALGQPVFYLQNITDIDDKIIDRARQAGTGWQELSRQFESVYKHDMSALGNTSVTKYARATDHIEDISKQVQTLLDKDHAYVIDGDGVYFEVSTFPDYGQLAGRTKVKKDDSQSRIDDSPDKRGWNDFALWKFSKPDEPSWEAPFGAGRPGWHIEDTAITQHFFGPQYDMHGGAVDLIFPHHEAEITQMEAISGLKPFVRHWVHTGFLNINKAKMAKSAGNWLTIADTLKKIGDPAALRMLFLQSHYRSPVNFDWDQLEAAKVRVGRWRNLAQLRWQAFDYDSEDELELIIRAMADIRAALSDDLNTPRVLEVVAGVLDALEPSGLSSGSAAQFSDLMTLLDDTLGLKLLESTPDITPAQKQLIAQRESARARQDFSSADELRSQLKPAGLELRDTPHGAVWLSV